MSFEEKTEMLQEKFFSSSSQADVNDISSSFILIIMSFNSFISEDEMKQMIK